LPPPTQASLRTVPAAEGSLTITKVKCLTKGDVDSTVQASSRTIPADVHTSNDVFVSPNNYEDVQMDNSQDKCIDLASSRTKPTNTSTSIPRKQRIVKSLPDYTGKHKSLLTLSSKSPFKLFDESKSPSEVTDIDASSDDVNRTNIILGFDEFDDEFLSHQFSDPLKKHSDSSKLKRTGARAKFNSIRLNNLRRSTVDNPSIRVSTDQFLDF